MNKKILKMIALVLAIILIAGVCWMANAFVGNPVSKALATRTAENHLASEYGDTDFYIDRVFYSFKDGCYHAFILSPTSIDTDFSLAINMWGKLRLDTYDSVTRGFNTGMRLNEEYRALTDQIFESNSFPYQSDICFGMLQIESQEAIDDPDLTDIPEYALVYEDLIIDKIYDIRELGAQAGRLCVYVDSEELTYEIAAEMLLTIRGLFDEANIPFRTIDFTLQHPKPEEGIRDDEFIGTGEFPYEEIYAEGMADRIKAADEALKAYYAEQDAKYK